MKKRILALLLAFALSLALPGTALAAGEDEPAAPEITAPEAPPMPEETRGPEEAPAPEPTPTPTPEEVPAPEETPTPEETPVPEESPIPEETPTPEETPIAGETVRRYFTPELGELPAVYLAAPESASLFEAGQRELRRLTLRLNAVHAAAGKDCSLYVSYAESVQRLLARAAAVTADMCGYETVPENWILRADELAVFEAVCREAIVLSPVVGETVFVPFDGEAPAEGTGSDKTLQIMVSGAPLEELTEAFSCELDRIEISEALESAFTAAQLTPASPAALPEDISPLRRAVVEKACALAGKTPYRWGGKSSALGWDARWGVPTVVLSEGHETSGTAQPGGLDCSGFVNWAFVNAVGMQEALETLGSGTFGLWNRTTPIAWNDVQPGDLLWYGDDTCAVSHVGIAVGRNAAGEILVCHASGRADNIVIETASAGGFTFASRPAEFYERFGE